MYVLGIICLPIVHPASQRPTNLAGLKNFRWTTCVGIGHGNAVQRSQECSGGLQNVSPKQQAGWFRTDAHWVSSSAQNMVAYAFAARTPAGDRRTKAACAHKIYSGVGKLRPSKFETRVARLARRMPLEWMAIPPLIGLLCTCAHAADVSRLPLQPDNFPISAAVTVPAGTDTVFLSGAMGPVVDPKAPKDSIAAMGDTETQVTGALTRLQATLKRLGLGMGDVVKMNVFLVGDPSKGGKMDFAGLMAGYTKFFGTKDQPNKPARSAVQVAGLVLPGALVEIELIAAKPH